MTKCTDFSWRLDSVIPAVSRFVAVPLQTACDWNKSAMKTIFCYSLAPLQCACQTHSSGHLPQAFVILHVILTAWQLRHVLGRNSIYRLPDAYDDINSVAGLTERYVHMILGGESTGGR